MTHKDLLKRIGIEDKHILNIYQYGSRVYGTESKLSDWDFIVILNFKNESVSFTDNLYNVYFYTPNEFEAKLLKHDISALECFYLPEHNIWKELLKFNFKLDKKVLQKSLFEKADSSFSKSEKKLTIESNLDLQLGKKSLYHAIRILEFGHQIKKYGKINDYWNTKNIHKEIYDENDFTENFEYFKLTYNKLKNDF